MDGAFGVFELIMGSLLMMFVLVPLGAVMCGLVRRHARPANMTLVELTRNRKRERGRVSR